MRKLLPLLLLFGLFIQVSGCNDIVVNTPTDPTSPGGQGNSTTTRVSFRVLGNASSVRVRFSNTADGLTQTTTTLPYNVTFSTTATSMFLFIDATPQTYPISLTNPFLSAQIIVNGELFREATSNDFTFNTISAFGTWRK